MSLGLFRATHKILGLLPTERVNLGAVAVRRAHRIKLPDAVIWAMGQTAGRLLVTPNTKDFPTDDPGIREPYTLWRRASARTIGPAP